MAKPNFRDRARIWQRRLRNIFLSVLGLLFTLGVHIQPADSRLIPIQFFAATLQIPPTPLVKGGERGSSFVKEQSTLPSAQATNTEQLVQQGRTFYQAGQFSQAAQSLRQAAQVYHSQGDVFNQALALNYLSLVEQKLGQWKQATEAINTSLDLLTHSKDAIYRVKTKQILALALNTQGSLQLALGKAEDALESWKQAAAAYAQVGDEAGRIGSLINQATAMQSLGLYLRAMKIFEQVEQTLQAQPNSLLKAAGLRTLGNVWRSSGDLHKSQEALEQSLAVAQSSQSPQEESATLLSLGNTALAFGNRSLLRDTNSEDNPQLRRCVHEPIAEKAKTYYNNANILYQKSATKSTSNIAAIQAQLNRLSVLLDLQQQPTAEELRSLESAIATLTPSRAAVYAKVNFAQSLGCLGHGAWGNGQSPRTYGRGNPAPTKIQNPIEDSSWSEEIAQVLKTAIQQAKDLKDTRAESYALGNLGQMYEQTKQWSIAKQHTESALNLAQMINAPDIAYQWQWQMGRLLLTQKDAPGAIAAYTQAVETLKSLRSDLVALNADIQFEFRDEVEPVYRQLVALLLQPKEPSQENLSKARDVIEALQLAELDNFFRDACSIAQRKGIDEVVDSAEPRAAVVYPIILADRVEVIVKLPQLKELRHYRTSKPKSQVESILDSLRQKLEERYTFRDREALSLEVYNWLIKPAEADLERSKVKTLVFVLDGSLRNIPMAALYNGKQYLIEKYSVALTPGLQLLAPKLQQQKLAALTAGLTESRLGFGALPNVEKELQEIKSVIPSKQLLNQAFTNTNIEKQVSSVSFPVVHLATHGKFSSQVEETFILAWNDKINVKELRALLQTREQVVGRKSRVPSPIELLVLSACETATGDQRAALGLAGIAVRSGARSTLASLWSVDDKSTAILMGEFYRQLIKNPTLTKAEALRYAQQFILQQYKEHPFYWAPYVLVGNWL